MPTTKYIMPVAVLYKPIATFIIWVEKFYKTVAVLFIRIEKFDKPIATFVIRVEKLFMTVEKFYKPTAKIFIRLAELYRPTVFKIELSENWFISSTQLIMTTTNKYKPTYILDTTTTIHNQWPAGNTRLWALAGWRALRRFIARISIIVVRQRMLPQTAKCP